MKTFLYFIITLCISCGCFISATNTKTPFALFGAAFGIWLIFFWGWNRRLKRQALRRNQEHHFREYMRGSYHRK